MGTLERNRLRWSNPEQCRAMLRNLHPGERERRAVHAVRRRYGRAAADALERELAALPPADERRGILASIGAVECERAA